jgi:hypothetical protein
MATAYTFVYGGGCAEAGHRLSEMNWIDRRQHDSGLNRGGRFGDIKRRRRIVIRAD